MTQCTQAQRPLHAALRILCKPRSRHKINFSPQYICEHLSLQLFTESSVAYLDVTQHLSFLEAPVAGTSGRAHHQSGAPAKKRRVESGWGVLRQAATVQINPYMSIPWYVPTNSYCNSTTHFEFMSKISVLKSVEHCQLVCGTVGLFEKSHLAMVVHVLASIQAAAADGSTGAIPEHSTRG